MSSQNEQQLLKIIKYIPTLFLIFISMIVIAFLYLEYDKSLNSQKDLIQKNYIQKNKDYIKHQTENTYNFILHKQETTEKELKEKLEKEMQKALKKINVEHPEWETIADDFEKIIGLKYLKGMHLNDSKMELNSHRDRHESIGLGTIGKNCFKWIAKDKRFDDIPLILETPEKGLWEDELKMLQGFAA